MAMDKKQSRLRRARQTRIRIAEQNAVRLCVHRSNCHIYAQIISDGGGKVLATASTVESAVRKDAPNGGNIKAAQIIGKLIAERAKAAGIETVAFDRSGFRYHGRVKALADAAREGGLKF
jgi:large subunit ribosomal protein L18